MTANRRKEGSAVSRRSSGGGGMKACDAPVEDNAASMPGPRLTVSYQRWCAALREDDLLFVECLLADVRQLLVAGGTFIVVGLRCSSVVIRDIRQANAFAAQVRALQRSEERIRSSAAFTSP
jgi:hypothetical protein